jgi:hypothetical protein
MLHLLCHAGSLRILLRFFSLRGLDSVGCLLSADCFFCLYRRLQTRKHRKAAMELLARPLSLPTSNPPAETPPQVKRRKLRTGLTGPAMFNPKKRRRNPSPQRP